MQIFNTLKAAIEGIIEGGIAGILLSLIIYIPLLIAAFLLFD